MVGIGFLVSIRIEYRVHPVRTRFLTWHLWREPVQSIKHGNLLMIGNESSKSGLRPCDKGMRQGIEFWSQGHGEWFCQLYCQVYFFAQLCSSTKDAKHEAVIKNIMQQKSLSSLVLKGNMGQWSCKVEEKHASAYMQICSFMAVTLVLYQ